MGAFSIWHILIVAVIFLIFFGSGRLPTIGSSLGKAIRDFKKAFSEPEEIDVASKDKSQPDKDPNRPK